MTEVRNVRVLIVDDDRGLAAAVQRALERGGARVRVAPTGGLAMQLARAHRFDTIVLDRTLPDLDGVAVCRRLRVAGVDTPILLTAAAGTVTDRVAGLDAGADDYMVKPYALLELGARVRALGRRGLLRPARLQVGDLTLDADARSAARGDRELRLTPIEFALLEAFMRRPGRVLTRDELLGLVWDRPTAGGSNVVDVAVRRLREKVDRPFGRASLETVHRVGYRLRPAPRAAAGLAAPQASA